VKNKDAIRVLILLLPEDNICNTAGKSIHVI